MVVARARALELRVPPLALVLFAAACMWLVSWLLPALGVSIPGRTAVAGVCAASGVVLLVAGVIALRKAHTTVNPATPDASAALVESGVFRWSRNPIYLRFLLVLGAWAIHLANVAAMLFLPAFVWYMNRFQIEPEERALETRFDGSYRSYRERVRRWI